MSKILTIEGGECDLLNPSIYNYSIREIAHSLSNINRYTGHTRRAYSVAEHSLFVCDMILAEGYGPLAGLCGLMHDAHEAYVGDVPSPIKQILGKTWSEFEDSVQRALLDRYELIFHVHDYGKIIKHFDLKALATERRDLLNFDARKHTPWMSIDTPGNEMRPDEQINLMDRFRVPHAPREWAHLFEQRFYDLELQLENGNV